MKRYNQFESFTPHFVSNTTNLTQASQTGIIPKYDSSHKLFQIQNIHNYQKRKHRRLLFRIVQNGQYCQFHFLTNYFTENNLERYVISAIFAMKQKRQINEKESTHRYIVYNSIQHNSGSRTDNNKRRTLQLESEQSADRFKR